jgi:hypothetical protein
MHRKAKAALRKAALTITTVIFFLSMLPGCAVVGPLLSVGSFIGTAPLQYASAAYTVGEYTYEYAANDKDPSEVIEGKIISVLDGSAFDMPDFDRDDAAGGTDEVMLADGTPASKVEVLEATMAAKADEPRLTKSETVEVAISAKARQERIEQILGRRSLEFERLELRRMAFLKARSGGELSLRQTSLSSSPDLFQGSGKTTLR